MADRRKAFDLQTSPCDRPSGSHQSREHRSSYDETDLGSREFNKYGEINHSRHAQPRDCQLVWPGLRGLQVERSSIINCNVNSVSVDNLFLMIKNKLSTDTLFIRGAIFISVTAYTLGSIIVTVAA